MIRVLTISIALIGHGCDGATEPLGLQLTFQERLESLVWIAYAPTGFDPDRGIFPPEVSIRADLQRLLDHGFDGVVTFASDRTLAAVLAIAREVGFRGVVMGLFMFNEAQRAEEVSNAIAAAEHVDGYGVGNEGLIGCGGTLYSPEVLLTTMDELRTATGRPVTTSEQIEDYLGGGCLDEFLLRNGDWLFPIVHPFNNGIRSPAAGVDFTVDRFDQLTDLTNLPVLFKEVAWPSCGDPAATEQNQERYFVSLRQTMVRFAYFEAFDQPFKQSFPLPWEPCWGVFRSDRSAKRFLGMNRP